MGEMLTFEKSVNDGIQVDLTSLIGHVRYCGLEWGSVSNRSQ